MKVTLTGAGSFRVGNVIVKHGVPTDVDADAFEKLKPAVKAMFETGEPAKAKKEKNGGKTDAGK